MDIFSLLYPRKCLGCGKGGKYLCSSCLGTQVHAPSNYSLELFSVWKYDGVVKKAILRLKYSFVRDIAKELGVKFAKEMKKDSRLPKDAVIVPIPLSGKRLRWRGFNQAEEIGRVVAGELDWEFKPTLLKRKHHTKPQVGLPKNARLRNTRGIFAVNSETGVEKDKLIIVFDDVWTTGATLNEATELLKKQGFRDVWKMVITK